MNSVFRVLLIAMVALGSTNAMAHSMEDVEASLNEKERYAQFVDQPAPEFDLTGVDGNTLSLADLNGKTVVLNFLYTRCTEACPFHMNLIRQLQTGVEEEGLSEEVVFITIATDREDVAGTRDNMRAYGDNFDLNPDNWHFLYRGEGEPPGLTSELAKAYGVQFRDTGEGVQVHGVVTHVIDPEGQMRARFHGLKFKPEHLVTYLTAIAKGPNAAADDGFWGRLHGRIEELLQSE
ncbi:protein SCO1/2 [Marinobacter segnicrescens]|uniref:Protein SCO1/2 n=1 Tax=Marinobacter segnicrescens TaxID=430453 RepID=A0A1I0HPX3_9GAMM|nr:MULTISPECIES: SCO family protein [Marinobacter]UZD66362.1 SCO family protein [Marinobacter sp. AN1]SET85210.1 protein SCO1/2 [Marinobacter segnicrescens]